MLELPSGSPPALGTIYIPTPFLILFMETTITLRRQRYGCYSDIVQGTIMFLLFIAVQLAMYDLLPSVPVAILSLVPSAPIMAGLAPLTQGDLVLITIITAYGAIWGVRLVGKAFEELRDIAEIESVSIAGA